MMDMIEASVITAKCKESGKTYGIRVEKIDGDWIRTWAFPINENEAKREGYDKNVIKGSLRCQSGYSGCPYCGTSGIYQCGCSRITCYDGENRIKCPWCGTTGDAQAAGELSIYGEAR